MLVNHLSWAGLSCEELKPSPAKALLVKGLTALGLMWGLGQVQGGLRVDMDRQAWESLLAMAVPKSFRFTGVNACIGTSDGPVYA